MSEPWKKAICSECHYKCDIKVNGEWQAVKGTVLPFFIAETLDESLDSGKMRISVTARKEPYAPFTIVRFSIAVNRVDALQHNRPPVTPDYGVYEPIYMLISSDSVVRKGIYFEHEIELVEITKQLERSVCDTMTFTNAIGHDYQSISKDANPVIDDRYNLYESTPIEIKKFTNNGTTINLPAGINAAKLNDENYLISGVQSSLTVSRNGVAIISVNGLSPASFTVDSGNYTIKYYLNLYSGESSATLSLTWTIVGTPVTPSKPIYTITSVVERLLEAAVTRRNGIEEQQYKLDAAFAGKYKNIAAPEFHITRSNLFEALLQVGAFIHAIPRLKWNKDTDKPDIITFDELGGNSEYTLPYYCQQLGYLAGIDSEGYCGNLDSIVENLITTTDIDQGSVTEPDYNAFKTTRTEEGTWIIKNDTVLILTDLPIYRLLSIEMGYVDNSGAFIGELIPFVYESAEYATLSSYNEGDFNSKGYALTYTQGDNRITGFSYKENDPISPALKSPAIINILKALGKNLPDDRTYYKNFAFRVRYIPIITARVKQYKPYTDFPLENSLINNQSANTVETEFYGEHLKGTIARLGNVTTKESYYFRFPTDMPKVGQIFDGRYIVALETRYETIGITSTLTMTKDYNKLSEYLGLNSNYRLFDVSEKQSVDRYINYCEKCIVGDDVPADTQCAITDYGIVRFGATFLHQEGYPVSVAITQSYDKDNNPIESPSLHACASFANGNSLVFTFNYLDNYGVGYSSNYYDDTQNTQVLKSYGDVYGENYYLDLKIGADIRTTDWNDQLGNGWSNNLPTVAPPPTNKLLFDTAGKPLIIQKDSRERLIVTYQIPIIANRKSIVIGQAMTKNNRLVTPLREGASESIMLFPFKLNGLRNVVDLSLAVESPESPTFEYNLDEKKIKFSSFTNTTNQTFQSWAIVDKSTGTFYFGENIELPPNGTTNPITFTFISNK